MKRRRVIFGAAAVLLAIAAGVIVWQWWPWPPGLSAPIELVDIPPGEFLMGSPENEEGRSEQELEQEWSTDETRHSVRITYPFKMGKYEVTQRQWREVMGTTIRQQRDKVQREHGRLPSISERFKELGKDIKDHPLGTFNEIKAKGLWRTLKALAVGGERLPLAGEGDDHPMYWVSRDEAVEFCVRLTELERAAGRLLGLSGVEGSVEVVYRLPTEAEWEYACRAGSTTRFANGDTEADLDKIGWCRDNSGGTGHPAGKKMPNAWGLHDMHGNVLEWCLDWYGDYPAEGVTDPFSPMPNNMRNSGVVNRGACWSAPLRYCRSASRIITSPRENYVNLGFRIVLGPPARAGETESGK